MNRIVISRTDSIGDVLLTLPICTWLKENHPTCEIIFLGKAYTKPIIECYDSVDEFVDWDSIENSPSMHQLEEFRRLKASCIIHVFPNKKIAALAKKARIPMRIGTSHRSFHLLTCNHRPNFTRKRSNLHEAQLNFELLKPLGLKTIPSLEELNAKTHHFHPKSKEIPQKIEDFIQKHSKYVILHPKSQGSALEWPIEKYISLSQQLVENNVGVIFTGTASEGKQFQHLIPTTDSIMDATGETSLYQLITLIQRAEGIVACSTGPLHIGGYLNIKTIGLFSPKRPIHPGRWSPLGSQTHALVFDENCAVCASKKKCNCIVNIEVEKVLRILLPSN